MSLYAVIDNNVINVIGLQGTIHRLRDYPIVSDRIYFDCIQYDVIEQKILQSYYPQVKFLNQYDLEILRQKNLRKFKATQDWHEIIRFRKQHSQIKSKD